MGKLDAAGARHADDRHNPANGRSVVASAGWETGPGSTSRAGGASEEIHHALGTGHGDTLRFAFAVDQTLPLGPIVCDD